MYTIFHHIHLCYVLMHDVLPTPACCFPFELQYSAVFASMPTASGKSAAVHCSGERLAFFEHAQADEAQWHRAGVTRSMRRTSMA
jgi:hypothetical protein